MRYPNPVQTFLKVVVFQLTCRSRSVQIQHISGHRSLQSLQEYLDVDKEEVVDKFRERMELAA